MGWGAHVPWQNGVCERHGGAWKVAFQRALLETVPEGKWDVEELCDQVSQAHNSMVRKDGYSPNQHVLGVESRVPSSLVEGTQDDAIGSAIAVGESGYEKDSSGLGES